MKIIAMILLLAGLAISLSTGKSLIQCPTGDGVTVNNDIVSWNPYPCVHCTCTNGVPRCAVQDCAAPSCENYFVPKGECCPVCPPGKCKPTGEIFYNNNVLSWKPDPCTHCSCINGQPQCFIRDCARPSCLNYFVPPGKCCPICPNGPEIDVIDDHRDAQEPQP